MSAKGVFKVGAYELEESRFYDAETHLWVARTAPTRVRCGFDPLGAETCGDIVAVSFEPRGTRIARGEAFGQLEAAKFVGPLLAPVGGILSAHNPEPLADPTLLNGDPMTHWLVEIESPTLESDLGDLLHGRAAVEEWFASEIRKFESQGMVAE